MYKMLLQRVLQIVGLYEDANDADTLRLGPVLKAAVARLPESGADLASQPTLSRLENTVTPASLRAGTGLVTAPGGASTGDAC
jgi:hypothetical protein